MLTFTQMNALGRTIVLITHEDEIAEYAHRIVRLRDGLIVDDRPTALALHRNAAAG